MPDESLFTSQTPALTDADDGGSSLIRGHVMYALVAGTIKGVRWYSSVTAPSDTPVVELYTPTSNSAGTPRANKTYAGSHQPSTWLSQQFDEEDWWHVEADELFVPTVTQSVRYVATTNFWTTALTNGNLVGIQAETDPTEVGFAMGNGKFGGGGPAFPSNDSGAFNNFFVDVIFAADEEEEEDLAVGDGRPFMSSTGGRVFTAVQQSLIRSSTGGRL